MVSGSSSTFSAVLASGSGTLNLTKTGAATLTLAGANTYTGATTITGGTLALQNSYATSGFAIGSGASLELNVSSGSRDGATTTFSGTGTLVKTGAGTVLWGSGIATFALAPGARIDVQAGTFTGGSFGNDVWTNNHSDLNVASGATFDGVEANVRVNALSGSGTIKSGFNGSGYTSLNFGIDNGSGTFSGILANSSYAANFVKNGTGTQVLTGSNTYTGVTTINGGILSTNLLANGGSASGIGASSNSSSNLMITGGTLQYTGTGASTDRQFQMGNTAAIDASGSGPVQFTSSAWIGFSTSTSRILTLTGTSTADNQFRMYFNDWISSTGLTKNGSGTWHLTSGNGNGATGPLTVNAGTLQINQNATQSWAGTITINSGGTLALDNGATDHLHSNVYLNGGTLAAGTPATQWGSYCFDAGLFVTGSGLTSTISAMGMTQNSGGTISITVDPGAILNVTGGYGWTGYNPSISKSGLGTMILAGSNSTTGSFTIGAGTVQIGDGTTNGSIASPSITNNGALIYKRSDSVTVSIPVTGTGSLTHAGSGTLILTGSNTYGGGTTVNSGVLQVGNGTVSSGIGAGAVTNNGSIVFYPGTTMASVPGAISGTGSVTIIGPGTVALGGNNSFTGGVTLNGGAVQIGATGFGNDSGALTVASAATIQFNSGFGTSTSARLWNLDADTTVNTNGASNSLTLTGTVTGSGALSKAGAGTLALNGVNAFTGSINVLAGTLALESTTLGSNWLNVSLGGKLSVTGTSVIGGNVTVSGNGGSLSNNASIDLTGGSTGINTLRLTSSDAPLVVGGGGPGAYSILNVNVGYGNSASLLDIPNGTLVVQSGGLIVNPNALPGATSGSATLISAAYISNDTLITTPVIYGQTAGSFGLTTSSTDVVLNWALGSNPDVAYWNGGLAGGMGSVWFVAAGNTNWVTDQTASVNSLIPGANTDLYLSSTNAVNLTGQSLGANGSVKSLTFNSGSSVSIVDAGSTLNFAGSGTVLNVNNPGQTLTLAVATTGSGDIVVDSGTLQVGNGGGAGSLPTGAISGSAGTLVYNLSANLTAPNTIGGGVQIVQSGSSVLTLSASNNFTGGATINAGTIRLGNANALGSSSGTVAINNGATLDLNGFSTTLGNLTSGSTSLITTTAPGLATLAFANASPLTYQGIISDGSGEIGISVTGTGTLTFTGSNSYSGGTVLSPGATVAFSKTSNLGANTGTITLNGGTLEQMTGNDTFYHTIDTGTTGGSITLVPSTTFQFNGYSSGTNAVVGSGPVTVNIPSTSTLKLSSKYNTGYTGNWTFNGGGNIEVQDGGSQSIGSGTVTLGGSNNLAVGWSKTISNSIISNGGVLSFCNGSWGNFSGPITTNDSLTVALYNWWNSGNANSGDISGIISGTGGLNVAGPTSGSATLVLTGTNLYTGPTIVKIGTLSVSKLANGGVGSNIGASSSDAANLVITWGGTFQYTGAAVSSDRLFSIGMPFGGTIDSSGSGPLNLTNTGTMGFAGTMGSRTLTLTGSSSGKNILNAVIADNGGATSLIKSGSSTWMLNAASTYTGVTTVNAGLLGVAVLADGGQPSSIGMSGSASSNLVINSGTLQYTGTGGSTNRQMQVGSAVTIDASGSGPINFTYGSWLGFSGTASRVLTLTGTSTAENVFTQSLNDWYGTTALVKNGPGTWLLPAQCGMSGGVTVNAGTLELGANTLQWSRCDVTVNSGGTLFLTSTNTTHIDGNLVINGGSVGSGTPNARWGSYSFDFGIHATGTGGTLSATGMVSGTSGNEIPITVDAGATLNVPGSFGWSAYNYNPAITENGPGTMILSGSNSTTGTLTVNSGTLQIGAGGTTGSIASNSIVNNSALVFNRADSSTVSGIISGTGIVNKTGLGTLILTGSNTYSGETVVNSGTLQLGNGGTAGSLSPSGALVNNGTLAFERSNTITQGTDFAATISGSGRVVQAGAGTAILSGSNSYSGGTIVSSGVLQVGGANALGTGGLTVNGGTLDLSGNSVAVPSFSGTGGSITNLASGTSTLTASVSGSSTYAGALVDGSGSVALTKTGTGTLLLTGSINASGLNASEGIVQLAQSGSIGAVSIGAAGKLELTANNVNSAKVIDTSSLSITSGGTLDLWDNALILRDQTAGIDQATNLSMIQGLVNTAFDNGAWDKPGITSSSVIADLGAYSVLTVMVYDNTVLGIDSFEGINHLTADNGGNQVMLKTTYLGDFDGNGIVNSADYGWLDFYYGYGLTVGDLNGDGQVNSADYNGIDYGYGYQAYGVMAGAGGTSAAAAAASPEAVPEPGTFALMLGSLAGLLARRGKSRARRA